MSQMKTSRNIQGSGSINGFFNDPMQTSDPYCSSHFQILNNNDTGSQTASVSVQSFKEQFFTLESFPALGLVVDGSPSSVISFSSSRSPFSPQNSSQSCLSNLHYSPDNTYGSSPLSSNPFVNIDNAFEEFCKGIELETMGACSDPEDGSISTLDTMSNDQLTQMITSSDLSQLLLSCAEFISDGPTENAERLMEVMQTKVSISGEPLQRLGAYLLEGLRAKLWSSGGKIYKKLNCKEPIFKLPPGNELMSYMQVLGQICPYYKFAYAASNLVIKEAMLYENHIHIIDFLIAQGGQWVPLIQALSRRPGGPPSLRITGVDDFDSSYAREGGLLLVGEKLTKVARECGVPFEFHPAAISGCEVQYGNIEIRDGEALAVNFPYMLHHMPDESVSTVNHRDRLLRLVRRLSPKVVTLVEQESNTNTSSFVKRFAETLDYYTAMFESIEAGQPGNDKQRISAEEHCVARDIVNIIACEDAERVERHEPLAKWRFRLKNAGFVPSPVSYAVCNMISDMLKEYSKNYRLEQDDGALVLGWKNRPMVTFSAWICNPSWMVEESYCDFDFMEV